MKEKHLNYKFYKGQDTYSDGEVEDEILKTLQENPDIDDILINNTDWAFLYHLSPIRENILDWYDFDPEGSVLEIGSGCGAITGLLCKKLKRVVGIDLSEKRSLINVAKNKKYDNFEIMLGNFEDIKLEEKFDYVTLIGVLEYSIYYIDDRNPFDKMIEKAKAFLKPGGKLIIAIENKLGLKYWAGATEDHTGNYFDGLQNYYGVDRVRTFSRKELDQMLTRAGFAKNEFFYPVPDYKMPTEIYSEDFLPEKGTLHGFSQTYDRERYLLFDEDLAYDAICEAGLFQEFANSFLVISSLDEGKSL